VGEVGEMGEVGEVGDVRGGPYSAAISKKPEVLAVLQVGAIGHL